MGERGGLVPSRRTNTNSASQRAGGRWTAPDGGVESWTNGGGWKGSTRRWRVSRNSAGGSSGVDRNWPGRDDGDPKTSSAEDTPEASNGTLLKPRRTQGNSAGQEDEDWRATSAVFNLRCIRSTIPLD